MPKYLMEATFSPQGLKGVLREGGSSRRDVVRKAIESVGGTLESFNFAFGEFDTYTTMELPDNGAAAAISLVVGSSGAVATRIIPLLTPEEADEAARRHVEYRSLAA